eukprot:Protomagalhaensia_wolfi_Nauph_80__6215@NODE_930_length_1874_cov_3_895368_g702_i0_p3_GENE_NODE_930_length_1874_cov_3_895368_g702_i0NODE_930_length_1874_cov_3_895368_g702_i0_p3_ORF_typecomplete_len163_score30_57HeLo/PF14479_6/0_19_NODE_930_length_1874_cov_3_895368_g702_i013071795
MFTEGLTDEEMEFKKMEELMELVDGLLTEARGMIQSLGMQPLELNGAAVNSDENKSPSESTQTISEDQKREVLPNIGKTLWKAEVDLENIEDIMKRLTEPPPVSLTRLFSDMNQNLVNIARGVSSWVQTRGSSVLPVLFGAGDPTTPPPTIDQAAPSSETKS